jgi:hypothetical protein
MTEFARVMEQVRYRSLLVNSHWASALNTKTIKAHRQDFYCTGIIRPKIRDDLLLKEKI